MTPYHIKHMTIGQALYKRMQSAIRPQTTVLMKDKESSIQAKSTK